MAPMDRPARHLWLTLVFLGACGGAEQVEAICNDEIDDDGDGQIDCDDADCTGTRACGDDTDVVETDTDTDPVDSDTDVPFPQTSVKKARALLSGSVADGRVGFATAGGADLTGDGKDDLLLGAYGFDPNGAVYVVAGPVAADATLDATPTIAGLKELDELGSAVAIADVTGDGKPDAILGAHGAKSNAGIVYVLPGPLGATIDLTTAIELRGEVGGDYAGDTLAVIPDVSGDGVAELLIGAYGNDAGSTDAGAAYLVTSPITTTLSLKGLEQGSKFTGEKPGDKAGQDVASAGDVDGDGSSDLLIGAYKSDQDGLDVGAAYLIYTPTGDVRLGSADFILTGEIDTQFVGHTVAPAGDLNDDGYDDFAIGAYGATREGTESGSVYLWAGAAVQRLGKDQADRGFAEITGKRPFDRCGTAVAPLGDIDGDNIPDLAIGVFGWDVDLSDQGAVFFVSAPVSGVLNLGEAGHASWVGETQDQGIGHEVGLAGDLTGDGVEDFFLGTWRESTTASNAGGVYIVPGVK